MATASPGLRNSRVPILRLNREVLIVALAADMADEDVTSFQDELGQRVAKVQARGVVVDVSAMDLIDSFTARVLNDTANMLRLLGAEVVICGLQPAVALTLVEMGRTLISVPTTFTLEGAIQRLQLAMRQADSVVPARAGRSARDD